MSREIRPFARVPRWLRAAIPLACVVVLGLGCTSIETTMVTRDESNQTWERHNCLNGIPITLKVPTHLKVYVFHKHYLEALSGKDGKVETIGEVNVDVVIRDVAHELMYTDKVFVVDFKRPAAGSSNLKVSMTEEQYIDEIQQDITEETIAQVTSLLGSFTGPSGLKVDARPAAGELKPTVTEIRSLVAVGIFEIDSPDFEQQVREFLNCHVNKSHDAWVVPPNVGAINRVSIPPGENLTVPYPPTPLCPGDGSYSATPCYNGDLSVLTAGPPAGR